MPATPQRSSKSPRALESESAGEPTPIKLVLAVLVFVLPALAITLGAAFAAYLSF